MEICTMSFTFAAHVIESMFKKIPSFFFFQFSCQAQPTQTVYNSLVPCIHLAIIFILLLANSASTCFSVSASSITLQTVSGKHRFHK
jgi:hypothetical protein